MNKYIEAFNKEVKITKILSNLLIGVSIAFETTNGKIIEYEHSKWWNDFKITSFDTFKDYIKYAGLSEEILEYDDCFDEEIMNFIKNLPNFKRLIAVIRI